MFWSCYAILCPIWRVWHCQVDTVHCLAIVVVYGPYYGYWLWICLQQKLRGGALVIMQKGQLKYPVQLTSLQLLLQFFTLSHLYQRAVHIVLNYKLVQPAQVKSVSCFIYREKEINWDILHLINTTNHVTLKTWVMSAENLALP